MTPKERFDAFMTLADNIAMAHDYLEEHGELDETRLVILRSAAFLLAEAAMRDVQCVTIVRKKAASKD